MNHDATHCFNHSSECPKTCYRAQLTEELKNIQYPLPVSWAMFKGTDECPIRESVIHEYSKDGTYTSYIDETIN